MIAIANLGISFGEPGGAPYDEGVGDLFAGRYELLDPLAEGGSGVVWRAWDHRNRAYVAAKVLRQVDAASLVRFMREQSVRVRHEHVLAPTGWAGEDDRVLLTMPIVRGGSVATLVGDHGPLPLVWVATLLDQLCAALVAIHALDLVHRDVKPANLLLDATGTGLPHLWLSDFGVATSRDEPRLTQGPYVLGTPGFLAPECLAPGWEPHPAADLYAAGMCALEMLVGRKLALGRGVVVAEGIADGDVAALLDQAPGLMAGGEGLALRELIVALTQVDAERRPTASPVRGRLAGILDGLARQGWAGAGAGAVRAGAGVGEESVEVFDQLPALPEGWGEDGRELVAPPSGGMWVGQEGPPVQTTQTVMATRPIPRPVVQPADVQPATVQPWSTPDLEPRRRQGAGTRGPLVALVLGAALVVVAVLLAIQ